MPLIQGFVGQRAFTVKNTGAQSDVVDLTSAATEMVEMQSDPGVALPSHATDPAEQAEGSTLGSADTKDFLLTIISRRSTKRAGLRYLRRGIDENGNVANAVETEQIMSAPDWDSSVMKTSSFVQYRGSIPLFFSQSPYSFKPVVVFQGTPEGNAAALKLHFQQLAARYGRVQVASLIEKRGNESKLGQAFEKQVEEFVGKDDPDPRGADLEFEWFDFHGECPGMRFQNVSRLFDRIGPQLQSFGWTEEQSGKVLKAQSGVLRTNCMDCLDRTNVVQSACARNILEKQLEEQDVSIDLQNDPSTSWFNAVWADNGDAISRQYAGTAALKGDFTRTRKRNISGALTDFGLTLTRYVKNIRNDWFTQTVIDFNLGLTDETSFIDFDADMQTRDYAVDLGKVRQNALDACAKICVEGDEDLMAGWTLSCPAQSNSLRSLPFEECVLLLTGHALYFCRMDWSTEKVKEFERIELDTIDGVARGVYITSTLARRNLDERRNVGFVIRVSNRNRGIVRRNTRSLTSDVGDQSEDQPGGANAKGQQTGGGNERMLAFKALPPKSSFIRSHADEGDVEPPSEIELTSAITDQIAKAVNVALAGESVGGAIKPPSASEDQPRVSGEAEEAAGKPDGTGLVVEEKDIISVADAKKSTGYIEQLGYSLKKLVWA